jgi:hypothetical protein
MGGYDQGNHGGLRVGVGSQPMSPSEVAQPKRLVELSLDTMPLHKGICV